MASKNRIGLGMVLVIALLMPLGKPAFANVRFQIKTDAAEPKLFLVHVRTSHYAFHSTVGKDIATKVLTVEFCCCFLIRIPAAVVSYPLSVVSVVFLLLLRYLG